MSRYERLCWPESCTLRKAVYRKTGEDMLPKPIAAGDKVAILPAQDSPPEDTLEIVEVEFVGLVLLRLVDQRIYSLKDRWGLTPKSKGFIEPVTYKHRAALRNGTALKKGARRPNGTNSPFAIRRQCGKIDFPSRWILPERYGICLV